MDSETQKPGVSNSCACPHCGQPLSICAPGEDDDDGDEDQDQGSSWENDLRHTMSPQNGGNEGPA